MSAIIFIVFCLVIMTVLPLLAGLQKPNTEYRTTREQILSSKNLPDSLRFFHRKWPLLIDSILLCTCTIFVLLWEAALLRIGIENHTLAPSAIILAAIFLPLTVFCTLLAKNNLVRFIQSNRPVITLTYSGYVHEDIHFPWNSIDNIAIRGFHTDFLIITRKHSIKRRCKKIYINLSYVTPDFLPEYFRNYHESFGHGECT